MKKMIVLLLLMTMTILYAAPMQGEVLYNIKQPDGKNVSVLYFGDEFFVTMESPDGYTLIENSDGWLTYAMLNADKSAYIPTDNIYSGVSASRSVGERHLRINPTAMRAKVEAGRKALGVPTLNQSRANFRARKPLPAIRNGVDTIIGLTVLIDFPDEKSTLTKGQIEDFVNKENYNDFNNNGSIRDYFYDVSNQKWIYLNVVTEFYTTKNNKSHYDHNISWMEGAAADKKTAMEKTQAVMHEALEHFKAEGFDFSQLSTQASSYFGKEFRAINFFYAGVPDHGWGKGLWPHKSALHSKQPYFAVDGATVWTYQMTAIRNELSVGTFIHETGHVLCGYPDLYSYEQNYENVIENYCHMSSSSSKNPVTFNPYFRSLMGWLEMVNIDTLKVGREYTDHANDAHVYYSHTHEKEWFFVENRRRENRSATLPGDGLMIWRINEDGNNARPSETNGVRLVEVVQADGLNQMAAGGRPDAGDFYNATINTVFGETSTPAATWSDGSFSGVDIRNISLSGRSMTFSIGELVAEENVAPTDILLSQNYTFDTVAVGTLVGVLSTIDSNSADAHTYQLLSESEYFELSQKGNELIIKAKPLGGDYPITLKTTDLDGLFYEKGFVIRVFDSTFALFPQRKMQVASASSEFSGKYHQMMSIDGDSSTFWHNAIDGTDPLPSEIVYKLDNKYALLGLSYLPRQDGSPDSKVKEYEVLVSADGVVWDTLTTGIWEDNSEQKLVVFDKKTAFVQYVQLVMKSSTNGLTKVSIAEFNLYYSADDVVGIGAVSQPAKIVPSIGMVGSKNLALTVPQKGNYSVTIYSLNGRVLATHQLLLERGVHTVGVQNMGSSVQIVELKGAGFNLVKKLIVK